MVVLNSSFYKGLKFMSNMKLHKLLFLFLMLSLLPLLSAGSEVDSELIKSGDCIDLTQSCSNCSFMNVTSIKVDGERLLVGDYAMEGNSGEYNYTFCNTSEVGDYTWCYEGDVAGGVIVPGCLSFEANTSGVPNERWVFGLAYLMLLMLGGFINYLGFTKPESFAYDLFAGFCFAVAGIMAIVVNFAGIDNELLAKGVGWVTIGYGALLIFNQVGNLGEEK